MTATAIYTNADRTVDLVVLDEADGVYAIVAEGMTDAQVEAVYAGETEYRVVGGDVEVGDGDTFRRLVLR